MVRVFILLVLTAFVAACATPTPREPARIDYRSPNTSGPSPAVLNSAAGCEPGGNYRVREGDTLSEIAESCGVSSAELAGVNGVYEPDSLQAGQNLTLPRPSAHTVRRGENLYRIGLRYNINYTDLAAHNGISPPYAIEVGQEIRIPGGQVRTVSLDPPAIRSEPPRTTATRETPVSVEHTAPPPQRTSPPPQRTSSPPASSGPVTFQWPIRGDIVSTFGPKPDGRRNDGINIAADEGDSVRAAAAGTVVYAGGELQGYGELVLIRHDGGWVTAYAHNSRLLVAEGDRIEQGQLVAEAGSTGSVDTAQVHFEIRRGVTPEDPMGHLSDS